MWKSAWVGSSVALIAFASACGGEDSLELGTGGSGATSTVSTGATSTGDTSSVSAGVGGGPPLGSYSVTFGPIPVKAGVERTQCVVKRLGNPSEMHVGAIKNSLSDGSHHLIVYRTNDTEEQLTPFDCDPFVDTLDPAKGSPLMITQKHEETLSLPQGVAFTVDTDQMVRLEMHYINASGGDLDVGATSTFVPITDEQFKDEADFLFIGNPDISIPPNASATLGPTFFPLPSTFDGVNFFAITGHTHQWGTDVTVATAPDKSGPDTPVYNVPDWQWSEPATVYQAPAFTIPSGGGFRFSCTWENKSDKTVSFGESANSEMCFFWAYYYPSKGAFVCAHTDQLPGGLDVCCPGNPLCSQLF